MKVSVLVLLICLSGCSWFHAKKPPLPDAPELVVTGAPPGAFLLVDGGQVGQSSDAVNHPTVIRVAPGTHTLEVRLGNEVVYRENVDVAGGEKRVITVLSGAYR